jgi:predicted phage terminase large subunit-like protein
VLASLDAAYTEREENDPSALTVWGVFEDQSDEYGGKSVNQRYTWNGAEGQEHLSIDGLHPIRRRFIMLHAWRKFLKFEGTLMPRHPAEPMDQYRKRCLRHQDEWGLVEWVAHTCRQFKVDLLLIEAKASGISAAQALQNRHSLEGWGIQLIPAKGDKVARAMAAVAIWSQGLVYAPDKDWAQMVIDEMASFPKAKYDDLADSAIHAINFLRQMGYAWGDEVEIAGEFARVRGRGKLEPLYPV